MTGSSLRLQPFTAGYSRYRSPDPVYANSHLLPDIAVTAGYDQIRFYAYSGYGECDRIRFTYTAIYGRLYGIAGLHLRPAIAVTAGYDQIRFYAASLVV